MKYIKRKYETPVRPWDKQRLEAEREIINSYGLRNKKELWKAQETLRKYRRLARALAAREDKEQEKLIIGKLVKVGVLEEGAGLDDILALTVHKFLDRRLQTMVHERGAANTTKHARQMIVHGKVKVGERKVVYPSYMIARGEEDKISVIVAKATKVVKSAEEKGAEATGTSN